MTKRVKLVEEKQKKRVSVPLTAEEGGERGSARGVYCRLWGVSREQKGSRWAIDRSVCDSRDEDVELEEKNVSTCTS